MDTFVSSCSHGLKKNIVQVFEVFYMSCINLKRKSILCCRHEISKKMHMQQNQRD